MPIIRIEGLRTPGLEVYDLLSQVSDAVAKALDVPAGQCWAVFHEIQDGEYLEGGVQRHNHYGAVHSPLVTVSGYPGRSEVQVARALESLAKVVAKAYGFETGNVFVEYREIPEGCVFTGGVVQ